jgi:hypothetical protein
MPDSQPLQALKKKEGVFFAAGWSEDRHPS